MVSAGMGLTSSPAAGVVLWCGFGVRTVSVAHGWLWLLPSGQGLFCSSHPPPPTGSVEKKGENLVLKNEF